MVRPSKGLGLGRRIKSLIACGTVHFSWSPMVFTVWEELRPPSCLATMFTPRRLMVIARPLSTHDVAYTFGCFTARGVNSHLTLKHVRERQFKQPFPCPECQRQGNKEVPIDGVDAWLLHVQMVHDGGRKIPTVTKVDGEERERKVVLIGEKRNREEAKVLTRKEGQLGGRQKKKLKGCHEVASEGSIK
ncbi:hypothetical protein EDB80DRAFT_684993 [Ilyonectria destructans]|nr:hypothetical protein EDB80DRAFT_684993 [Ilyonectria destructans]